MAKDKKEARKKPPAEVPLRVKKHIAALGLPSFVDYLDWCKRHGFPAEADKNSSQLEDEKRTYKQQVALVEARHRTFGTQRELSKRLVWDGCKLKRSPNNS